MRILLTYFLSFLIIFAPTYSAYAAGITKGQIIAVGKKGGAMIKTGAGSVVKGGGIVGITAIGIDAAMSWCRNNQKKCKDIIGDMADVVCDDDGCTANRKDDDTGGGDDDGFVCDGRVAYRWKSPPSGASAEKKYSGSYLAYANSFASQMQENQMNYSKKSVPPDFVITSMSESSASLTYKFINGYGREQSAYASIARLCEKDDRPQSEKDKDRRLSDDELGDLAKKISERMDNDDIINYYNNDYGDITINNQRYDGDDINQQTNIDNKCQNNSCNEISKDIENAVRKGKIDIDDVNEKNCTMDKAKRKYIQCSFDFDSDTTNNDNDTTNNDNDTTNNKKEEDEEEGNEHWCDTTDLTREACEYFDWVDDEPDTKEDKKVEVEDEEEEPLDKDKIDIDGACPPDEHISISMPWGYSTTITFTYEPYCDFARKLKPYMTASGAIVAMYIVGSCGRRI